MNPDNALFTPEEREVLNHSFLVKHRLEEQYRDLDHQHDSAVLGMWVFLATEVLFFGAIFLGLAIYRYAYQEAFEKASEKLNFMIGGINTIVLLVSSGFMVLAVHYAKLGRQREIVRYLVLTAVLGCAFLCFKGYEYYTDYRDNLIPGWRFEDKEWMAPMYRPAGEEPPKEQKADLHPGEVPHVKLFLMFYWIMTGIHGLHVTIGIGVVIVVAVLAHRGHFTAEYNSPVDVTGLYWHFVDTVWIFLLPMLYLLGTHTMKDVHF